MATTADKKSQNVQQEGQPGTMGGNHSADVIIIGGGPAGIAAAIWCTDLGLRPLLLEQSSELGGQLLQTFNTITNYPGLPAADGGEMLEKFLASLDGRQAEIRLRSRAARVFAEGLSVELATGETLAAKALIVATGVRRRRLGITGEGRFAGHGILFSGVRDRELAEGKRVAIVGGGDSALENALIFREIASSVCLIHRRNTFRGRREFTEAVIADAEITKYLEYGVSRIIGEDCLESLELQNLKTGEFITIGVDCMLIRIGVVPNTDIFRGVVDMDAPGYITVNSNQETSAPGIFAIGDTASLISPSLSTAVGTAGTAAKAAYLFING